MPRLWGCARSCCWWSCVSRSAPWHLRMAPGQRRRRSRTSRALTPTPRAQCGPGSRPETGVQGRVSPEDHESGRAAEGFTCNTELVGQYSKPNAQGTVGGFKVERYVDAAGHECAYYDTTLLWPTNALDQEGGVNVLDMADPAHPALTTRLVTPAMDTPHESLVLSQSRGLLVAVAGNLATNVGQIDIYDVSKDCRQPEFRSTTPLGVLGHESGLSPDGRTFYSASPAGQTIVAVDISDPVLPRPLWLGHYDSHGLSISGDGNRAYVAGIDSGLIILDTTRGAGARAQPEGHGGRPTPVALDEHSAERDSDHHQGTPVPRGDRRVRRPVRGRRGPDHRHRRRGSPKGRLEPAARGPPEGELRGAEGRQRRAEPGPGLRRPLLQRADARRSDDRRLQHDPLGAAGLRHPRPGSTA